MVRRNAAIALGIICMILVASLVGTIIVWKLDEENLRNQVNNLNDVVSFRKTMIWLSNKTYTISPNENVSAGFYAPCSGDVRIVAYWQPANPNIWFNLTWGARAVFCLVRG